MAFERKITKSRFMMNRGWAPYEGDNHPFDWAKRDAVGQIIAHRYVSGSMKEETLEWHADSMEWEAFAKANPDAVL